MKTKEEEIEIVYQAITHPAGFDVDIAGVLLVRQYEHPQWAVEWENYDNSHNREISVKEFDDPKEAARFFVEKRHEMEIGLDFDRKAMEGYLHE